MVEAIVLVVVFSILRKISILTSWKVIAFYIVVIVGLMAASSFLSSLKIQLGDPQQENFFHFCILSVFMILFLFNFCLLAIIADVRFWKACLVGIIMSLINTFMVMGATTFCG